MGEQEVGNEMPQENLDRGEHEPIWAAPFERLQIKDVPGGARTINVNNRMVASPLQGFGPMWQRNYRVRLSGVKATPSEVVKDWKLNFAVFQPPENHFYPSLAGVKAGEFVFIESTLPLFPGSPGIIPMKSGVVVLYCDETAFTVMTPEGFPISGWNTFSAYEEDGTVVAQVQGLIRTSDPIYEFGFRYMGGEAVEDKIWFHVLRTLAAHWGIKGQIQFHKVLIDPDIQWKNFRNVWKNAAIRSFFYLIATPFRWMVNLFRPKSSV